ncbi:MAG: hypothetical protein ABIP05_11455 [Nitrospiraceae bacterium]
MVRDCFGFLPFESNIEFEGGSISPVSNYDAIRASVEDHTYDDGFLYPHLTRLVRELDEKTETKWPPSLTYQISASHELSLSSAGTLEELRRGPSGFVIHLLAYLFGVRLQFHDWWVDGRMPIHSTHNIHVTKAVAEDFLSNCYQIWRMWPERNQKLISNLLFMHSRAPSYEWDWERFMIEYMVFDGCWKLSGFDGKRIGHGDRIKTLCDKWDIPADGALIDRIVGLRNDLFHETLWDKSQPCTGVSSEASVQAYNLRRLNQRLIPALLGYNNAYVKTSWWALGTCLFEKP